MTSKTISLMLFSASYCDRCKQAKLLIQQLIEELNQIDALIQIHYSEIDVVKEIDLAVELGILTTPSIVLNNQLIFNNMPSIEILKVKLTATINHIHSVENHENR